MGLRFGERFGVLKLYSIAPGFLRRWALVEVAGRCLGLGRRWLQRAGAKFFPRCITIVRSLLSAGNQFLHQVGARGGAVFAHQAGAVNFDRAVADQQRFADFF